MYNNYVVRVRVKNHLQDNGTSLFCKNHISVFIILFGILYFFITIILLENLTNVYIIFSIIFPEKTRLDASVRTSEFSPDNKIFMENFTSKHPEVNAANGAILL